MIPLALRLSAFLRWAYLTAIFASAMNVVQPSQNHDALAGLDAYAVQADPLFDDDVDSTTDATIATIVAAETDEASLNIDAVGDHGKSCGALQKLGGCGLSRVDQMTAGIDQIRLSFAMSRSCPWCGYLGGPKGIDSPRVHRMSKHRERLTVRILVALSGARLDTSGAVAREGR